MIVRQLNSFLYILVAIFCFAVIEFLYISNIKKDTQSIKKTTHFLTMADFSISTEANFIRHRSLTHSGEIFRLSPSLLPYFPSEFCYGVKK